MSKKKRKNLLREKCKCKECGASRWKTLNKHRQLSGGIARDVECRKCGNVLVWTW